MSYSVWQLLSIENCFYQKNEELRELREVRDNETNESLSSIKDLSSLNESRTCKVDYDYADENAKPSNKIKNKIKHKFHKIENNFYISDISKYVKAYAKRNESNTRSEIGITTDIYPISDEERIWINNYIYNFISHCLLMYSDCKHYIVIKENKNLVQKLTGTGYGYYGVYFTNGKKVGGMDNLLINIKQVKQISYNVGRALQWKITSDTSVSNYEDACSISLTLN